MYGLGKGTSMADDDRDEIARGIIEEALELEVTEHRAAVERARKELKEAKRRLRKVRKAGPDGLVAWRERGELDRLVAMKALTIAQIKDLNEESGHYTAAVTGYLSEHHPPATPKPADNADTK
jgi:IS5 family transposase